MNARIDPKTGKPYTGVSPRKVRKAAAAKKNKVGRGVSRSGGFFSVEEKDLDHRITSGGDRRKKQRPTPTDRRKSEGRKYLLPGG